MTETAIVFPLLPGKRLALAQFVELLTGERQAEHDVSHASVAHESWFLQATPQGDIVIIYLAAADPTEVFADLAVSQGPFETWFRDQVSGAERHGFDTAASLQPSATIVASHA